MARRLHRFVVALLLTLPPAGVVAAADLVFRSDRDGIEFRYPDGFVAFYYLVPLADDRDARRLRADSMTTSTPWPS